MQTSRRLSFKTIESLQRLLERRGIQNLFYAFTIRSHPAKGHATDISYVRYPYREPDNFREFQGIVSIAAGSPPRHPDVDYSMVQVHVLPARTSERQLLEMIQATRGPVVLPDLPSSGSEHRERSR